jgi:hypothetical protein
MCTTSTCGFFAFWRPYAGQDLAAPTLPNGGRQLCRQQFAKRVLVTQISDHINKQKHLSEIGASVADLKIETNLFSAVLLFE